MSHTFVEGNKISIASTTTAGAAGTSTITTAAVDMSGFDEVCWLVPLGTIVTGAVTSLKMQQSDDDAATDDYTDLTGTSITIADTDDDKLKYLDFVRPAKRYVKLVISRATQAATIGGIIAIQRRAGTLPVTQGTNVAGETHFAEAEGTA